MMQNAPSPIDTLDFQFKLQCRLRIFQTQDSSEFNSSYNLVAVASKYNLLFVGTNAPYIQVIQLQSLQKCVSKDGEIKDYLRRNISLPSRPQHLSVNCTCTRLCVIVEKDGCTKVIAYDVTSFLKQNVSIIQEIRLSATPGIKAVDASWNPTIPSMYAVCKNNGTAGVYDLKESNIELNELPEIAAATCLCWSPKGKQIAIGSRDGKIIQYKPDLKVAKVINGPPLDGSQFPVSLQWISNYQFIAIYKSNSPDGQSNLFVINCPKAGNITYINYEDICYSYGTARPSQFYMMYQNIWNILMVASSNSMEVGLMGFENDTWTQWILTDAARAELPLSTTKQDTLPIGLSLDTSSTHRLSWGESSLSPMPVLLLLSHHGVLCCFHAVNLKPDAAQICQSPENLDENNSAHLYFTTSGKSEIIYNKAPEIKSTEQSIQITAPQTTAFSFTFNPSQKPISAISQSEKCIDTISSPQKPIATIPQPQKPIATMSQPQKPVATIINVHSIQTSKSDVNPKYISSVNSNNSVIENLTNSINNKHSVQTSDVKTTAEQTRVPEIIPQMPPNSEIMSIRNSTSNNEDTEAFVAQMIKEECGMLESELKILLQLGQSIYIDLGTDNEATNLTQNTNTLQTFLDEVNEISQTQAAEITLLKQILLQTWALYEEARSRLAINKDPTLTTLILVQPLDAVSLRQLEEIHYLFYYLESQLKQVNIALDEQWETFQDYCKKKLNLKLPNIETIYQTMVKQNATIQKQVYIMKDISTRIRIKLRINTVPHLLLSLDNNNKLEEQLHTLYIDSKDCCQLKYEKIFDKQKRLTDCKFQKLRNLFEKRRIVHVSLQKPHVINFTTTLSALISAPFSPIVSSKKLHPQKLIFVQSTPKPMDSSVLIKKSEKKQMELFSNEIQPNIQNLQQKTQETKFLSNQNKNNFSSPAILKEISTPNGNIFGFGEASATSAFVPTAQNIFTNNSLFNVNTTSSGPVNKQDLICSDVPQKSTDSTIVSLTSLFPIAPTLVNTTLVSTFSTSLPTNIISTAKQVFVTESLNVVLPTTKFVFSGSPNISTPFVSNISTVHTDAASAFSFSNLSITKIENTTTSSVSSVNTKSLFSNVPKVSEGTNSPATTTSKSVFPFGPSASTGNTMASTFNEKSFSMTPVTTEIIKPPIASTIFTSNTVIPANINVETTQTTQQVTSFATTPTSIFNTPNLSHKTKTSVLSEVITPTVETKTDILHSDQNKKTDLGSPNKMPKDISTTFVECKSSIFNTPTFTTTAIVGTDAITATTSTFASSTVSTSSSVSTSSTAATTTTITTSGIFSKISTTTTIFTQHSTGSIFSTTQAAPSFVNQEQTPSIFGGLQKSVTSGNNSIFKSSQVFETPKSSALEINQSSISTISSTVQSPFNTISSPVNKSHNTTNVISSDASPLNSSSISTTSINEPLLFTSNSTSDPRKPFIFETTTQNSIFSSSNVPDTSTNVFGPSTLKSTFPTVKTTANNVFHTASSTFTSTSNSSFFNPSTSTSSLFGQSPSFSQNSLFSSPTSTNSGNIFGGTSNVSTSIFGNTPSSSFAASSSNTPFGSVFVPSSNNRPFTSTNDSFHFSLNSPSSTSSNEEAFGFTKPFTTFATNSSGTEKTSFNFGNFTVSTTSSGFGSGFTQNPFNRTVAQEQPKSPFNNTSLFASPTSSSSTNIFGGNSSFNKSAPSFGGPPTFGQGSAFGQTSFGANSNAFSASSQAGPFSGGSQASNQIGFGASPVFGSTPTFASSPGGFGGPPNFGSSTSFGMNSNFNSPNKLFSSTSSDTFGSSTQQNSTFANLANQPTLGFGNLAQQSQPPTSQSNFSGGSSFSTWR